MNVAKRIIDVCMTIALIPLMAYQVTGEAAHEWIGIAMITLVIIHQVLNRKWYSTLFKGNYTSFRILSLIINILLIISFVLTSISGMSMSNHAVPFLYNLINVNTARTLHLAFSYWSFILMGLHIGLHLSMVTSKMNEKVKLVFSIVFTLIAGYGFYLFMQSGILNYIIFKSHFAFLDYEKSGFIVFLENISMLIFFVLLGHNIANVIRYFGDTNKILKSVVYIMAALIIGFILSATIIKNTDEHSAWGANDFQNQVIDINEYTSDMSSTEEQNHNDEGQNNKNETSTIDESDKLEIDHSMISEVEDGFVKIDGGKFLMGSPDAENWRIDDETLHEVTVSPFYIDKYEIRQKEYLELIGDNPSEFKGDDLPVENVTWLDAIKFANAKSLKMNLIPCYVINGGTVTWNLSANGYRLPTEAEWEFACRAGTTTPFNIEKSIDATEANFYGHYPYEIEENYFNDSVLEARPGNYRGNTINVGSFVPNVYGLYDMHGNVNEWCFDFYAMYDINDTNDPVGPATGTRHVYRGGGWNDFAKNMRSAYRAAGEDDFKSYNLGIRLVRNGTIRESREVKVQLQNVKTQSGKVLIAYFSWSGNTKGIAEKIKDKLNTDIFEIKPKKPYSTDYSTVLMEAQDDQHHRRRPELDGHVENMDNYDIILLGYPNWWASIPMPIATFLEEYDFKGKTIVPFCSHGGGRFGQSITAISKLAPYSKIGTGLSVHYSGGSTLTSDIDNWLKDNNITKSNDLESKKMNENTDSLYTESIEFCTKNGIIRNTGVNEFSPKEPLKKELSAMILYRLENTPEISNDMTIPDVERGRWYQRGAYWVLQNDIILPKEDGSFGVNDTISKSEFLDILWRYAGKPDIDKYSSHTVVNVDDKYVDAVVWALNNSLTIGDENTINFDENINREETAYAIMNLLKIKETPYMDSIKNEVKPDLHEAEFTEKIEIKVDDEKKAVVRLIDSKATRELLAELPMKVNFMDFGNREKFGRVTKSLSEEEALLSGYNVGDFSYGTAYDCLIIFYEQDNEIIDGVMKLGEFESGLEYFSNNENIDVEISVVEN